MEERSVEEKLCCFAKKWNDSAATVKTVQCLKMGRFYVPGKVFAHPRTSAGVFVTIPASGYRRKPRPWISPNTIRKITHYEDGGQLPVLTSVLLLKHFEEIIFRQNGDSQFPCLSFFGSRVFSNHNKACLF